MVLKENETTEVEKYLNTKKKKTFKKMFEFVLTFVFPFPT